MEVDAALVEKLKALTAADPSLGYRALHARLKEESDFQQIGMKKVQSALQKLRADDAPEANGNTGAKDDIETMRKALQSQASTIFSASDDGTVREWSHQGELVRTLFGAGGVQCVEVTDDYIIAGDSAGMLRFWSRSSGEMVREIQVAGRYVKGLAVADGRVITGDYCNMVQQWNLESGQRELICEGHTAGVVSVAVAGDHIITGGGNGYVFLFDRSAGNTDGSADAQSGEAKTQPVAKVYKANGFICSLEVSDQNVLIPDRDEQKAVSVRLFNGTGGILPEAERTVRAYKCGLQTWQAATAGPFVLVLCTDFTVKQFSEKTQNLLASISVEPSAKAKNPYALKVSGDRAFVGYIDSCEIYAFSLRDGKRVAEGAFKGHQGTVNAFCVA